MTVARILVAGAWLAATVGAYLAAVALHARARASTRS